MNLVGTFWGENKKIPIVFKSFRKNKQTIKENCDFYTKSILKISILLFGVGTSKKNNCKYMTFLLHHL